MSTAAELLEILMLLAFGFSWPLNIIKSVKTKSTKGKSLWFLVLIDSGYICGIIAKLLRFGTTDNVPMWIFAFCVYILNLVMVSIDLVLYFVNKKRESKAN